MHLNAVWSPIQFHEAMLSAGEQRYVRKTCIATVGAVSNAQHANRTIGKAGLSRHMGVRPTTRAMATNPCDHPMGGKAKKCAFSLLVLAFFFLAAYMMQSWPCSFKRRSTVHMAHASARRALHRQCSMAYVSEHSESAQHTMDIVNLSNVLEHGLLSIVRAALGPHNPASDVLLSAACDLFVRHKCSTSKTALTCIPDSHQDVIRQAQH